MNWFHKHRWKLVAKTYAPPIDLAKIAAGTIRIGDHANAARMMMGCTDFLFQCEDPECRTIKRDQLLGKEEIPK